MPIEVMTEMRLNVTHTTIMSNIAQYLMKVSARGLRKQTIPGAERKIFVLGFGIGLEHDRLLCFRKA